MNSITLNIIGLSGFIMYAFYLYHALKYWKISKKEKTDFLQALCAKENEIHQLKRTLNNIENNR